MLKALILLLTLYVSNAMNLVITTGSVTSTPGTTFTVTVQRYDSGTVSTGTDTVYLFLDSGGLFGPATSKSFIEGDTDLIFSGLYIAEIATYTLYAACSTYEKASITVTIGVSTTVAYLVFGTPTSATGCPINVYTKDVYGATVTSGSTSISLTLDSISSMFTTVTQASSNGVASFNSCPISNSGTFRLIATATGLPPALSDTFTVTETLASIALTAPTGTVYAGVACTISMSLLNTAGVTFLSSGNTITITKSSGSGTITTAGVTTFTLPVSASVTFSQAETISITATCSGSNCGSFTVTPISIVVSTNAVIDVKIPTHIEEGTTASYEIGLVGISPTYQVTVSITTTSVLTITTTSVVFAAGSTTGTYQSVSITVPMIGGTDHTESLTISHSITTSDPNYSAATFTGIGMASGGTMTLIVYTTTPTITVDKSLGSASYQISISQAPKSTSVTVAATFSGTDISISPSSVTFTTSDYSAKTITVTSLTSLSATSLSVTITNTITSADTLYSIYSGTTSSTIATVVMSSFPKFLISNSFLNIAKGESSTYSVSLSKLPTATVTVSLSISSTYVTLSTSSLSFTTSTYSTAQTITVTVSSIPASKTNIVYGATITHSASSTDTGYSGLKAITVVEIVNTCEPAVYDWFSTSTCVTTLSNFGVSSNLPVPCSTGYYYDTSLYACTICPAGKYCPNGIDATSCQSGWYQTSTGQTTCIRASAGTYSTSLTSTPTTTSTGYYSLTGETAQTQCLAGDYCSTINLPVEKKCALGTYTSSAGQISCSSCAGGYSCITNSSPVACNSNDYSPANYALCMKCSSVFSSCANTAVTMITEGNKITSNTIGTCGTNKVCSVRFNYIEFTCPYGTKYSSSTCAVCTSPNICTGTSTDTKCATYAETWGIICLVCAYPAYDSGSACKIPASKSSYSGSGSSESACADYTWSPQGYWTCDTCSPGYQCTKADTPTTTICINTDICVARATDVVNCPAGTYNSLQALMSINECLPCPPDQTCDTKVIAGTPTAQGLFATGSTKKNLDFYCISSETSGGIPVMAECNQCSAGNYCIKGFAYPILTGYFTSDSFSVSGCPFGKYLTSVTAGSVFSCAGCSTYSFCPRQSGLPTICPLGMTNPSSETKMCVRCGEGTFCPGGSLASSTPCISGSLCPRGTYSDTQYISTSGYYVTITNAQSEYDYVECDAGYYCAKGSTALPGSYNCVGGYYCLVGTPIDKFFACPPGTFSAATNNVQKSNCGQCTAGSGCMTGSSAVTACLGGFYCPAGSERSDQFACPEKKYSSAINNVASTDCTNCAAGYFCPPASTQQYSCPEGTYLPTNPGEVISDCLSCTGGYYCGAPHTSSPSQCGAGFYCNEGATAPLDCEPGYYCSGATMTYNDMLLKYCPAGYLCPSGVSSDLTNSAITTYDCVSGYYCLQSALFSLPCRPGTYLDTSRGTSLSSCKIGDAGYYLDSFASTTPGTQCPAGYYCLAGTSQPVSCPIGTYNPSPGGASKDNCVICDAGYYCDHEATVTPKNCPEGSYCLTGVSYPTLCPIGTYRAATNAAALTECTPCDAGSYCDTAGQTAVTGPCTAGYYCLLGSITATPVGQTYGYLCPAGSYCPEGTTSPVSCSAGTFNNYEGQSTEAGCIICPVGNYCSLVTDPYPSGHCDPGYFCGLQETSSQPPAGQATLGHYAAGGTPAEVACYVGTFQDTVGQSDCKICTAGYYCPNTAMDAALDCTVGHYCPEGTVDPIPCPPGTFRSTTGATDISGCNYCTAGKYCAGYGLSAESGDCAAGYYCKIGSPYEHPKEVVATANIAEYGPCPKGYYCEIGTTLSDLNPCPAGTYNPAEVGKSSDACLKCTAGRLCASTAMYNDDVMCPETYFCPEETGDATIHPCTAGHYCAEGSDYEKPCHPGYYTDADSQIACADCPVGSFCGRQTSTLTGNDCPAGYYCPLNTKYNKEYACPPGRYHDNLDGAGVAITIGSEDECKDCPAGKYCNEYGIGNVSTLDCEAGFYCTLNSLVSKPVTASYGGACAIGEFCPIRSSGVTPCTEGSYCSSSQLSAVTGPCTEGHYCKEGATVPTPIASLFSFGDVCPKGSYCTAETSTPILCSTGKYLPYTGGISSSDCLSCPAGFYCPNPGTTDENIIQCPDGYYCQPGTTDYTLTPCSAGHYCPLGSHEEILCAEGTYQDSTAQSTCKDCTAGNYCEKGATALTPCEKGYYCLANTGYKYSYPCPAGTYMDVTGSETIDDCKPCTAGKFCYGVGLLDVTENCKEGYYCTGSAEVATPPDNHATGSYCPRGTYCPVGSSVATDCDPGKYCITQGISTPSGDCFSGYYCVSNANTPVPVDIAIYGGTTCSQGSYCQTGSSTETPCPAGKFGAGVRLTVESDCAPCPYGYYCATTGLTAPTGQCSSGYFCEENSQSSTENDCTVGHYCPAGSFEPVPCYYGTYQPSTAQSSCDSCPEGKYCERHTDSGLDCPAGYYCPLGTRIDSEFPCLLGTYSDTTGLAECLECPAGYECVAGSDNSGVICQEFHYCPAGAGRGYICPGGSHGEGQDTLTDESECTTCPTGFYCVDGRISAQCEAGYFCTGGSSTPTPIGNNIGGSECSANHYCPTGSTVEVSCPTGKFNKLKGGKSVNDCSDCSPGYYCPEGSTSMIDCPAGSYCPQGYQEPVSCPVRTYNAKTLQDSENSCLVCPGGYMCTEKETADYTNYECNKIGAYCVVGAQVATPCPPGTYSSSTTAASIDDCLPCEEGYQCPGGSDLMLPCLEGTYCPKGSAYAKLCEIGYYCPPKSKKSYRCPKGYYCPKYEYKDLPNYVERLDLYYDTTYYNTSKYIQCPTGYACPEGSFAPTFCQPGYYALNDKCLACPTGTYANNTEGCKICDPGYICVLAATRPDPMYLETQGGYICPAGYYCPEGVSKEIPCTPGTYNTNKGQYSEDVCIKCAINTYTDSYGNANCYPCGSSAYSTIGSTTCECTGAYRSYMKSDGTCRCIPGYVFLSQGVQIADQDGVIDCFPKVYDFADKGLVRDPSGLPKDPADCSAECDGGSGTRLDGVGICQCTTVKSLDEYCNKECRDNSDKFSIVGSTIYLNDGEGSVSLDGTTGYYGFLKCSEGCTLYSMEMTDTGPQAVYGGGTALQSLFSTGNARGRRLVTASAGISNPVICISLNDTYIFSISKDHYPVYSKDSLLNTNKDFDYGAFQQLASLMDSASSSITIFAYTFQEQGIYDFIDSSTSDLHMIISVMGSGQQCPDSDIPIRTRTGSSLLTVGTQSKKNIISDPDWVFICSTIAWLIVMVILIIMGVYFFENKKWNYRFRLKADYRKDQINIELDALTKPESSLDESGKDESGHDDSDKEKAKGSEKELVMEDLMANDDIDPMIFQAMLKSLQEQDAIAKNTFFQRTEDGQGNMQNMLDKINKLKNFLKESLEGLNEGLPDNVSEEDIELTPEKEVEKALEGLADNFARDTSRFDDAKKKLMEILNDPNLSDKDKRSLIEDFNANIDRIDQALADEQMKANEILSKRLLDRKNRKKAKDKSQIDKGQEPEAPVQVTGFLRSLSKIAQEKDNQGVEEERKVIEEKINDEKNEIIKKMRQELSDNLKQAKDKREKEAMMEDYNRKAKELELRMQEEKERQEAELMQRLKNRKKPKGKDLEIETPEAEAPGFFKIEDQEKIEVLQDKHEQARQELYEKQEEERAKVLEEVEKIEIRIPKTDEREKLEAALKSTSNELERKELMTQINMIDEMVAAGNRSQQSQLEAKLLERKRLRALKEAELKKKHQAEQAKLDDKEDQEIAELTDNITKDRIEDIMRSGMSPEEITKKIKEMIDEKHELELSQLISKKQEILAEKQTYMLQDSLGLKSAELQKTRKAFANKRNEIETSALHPSAKMTELKDLEKKESDALTQIDYDFINNLGKAQDEMWRGVEDEFRQRFLDLADKHLSETSEILKKMRQVNPALLEHHLKQAQDEALDLRKQVENDYKNKVKELDVRQREIMSMQGEKEREIEELKRQLDEADAKKKEMFEVDRMRREMEEKQRKMIEEMRRRGIKPEQMEEMIKKHQQEMSEWEAVMEKERLRQKERMQERLNARLAKYQERMAQKVAKYKEENLKIITTKEDEKLELKFNAGRPDLLYEPIKDIDSKLRVNPLPIFTRSSIKEYADYSNLLQSLLIRVKKIERLVATVDLDKFEHIMSQLETISGYFGQLRKH
ncbi:hypothetical protein SteCoe_3776 [Stentor coeruleus]|uniref:TNFR-Cys domain-containing protein n=1 Tax=Stentor coeruleus TaxID=5963 RepID=A0A1R2CWE8_9CILI|nr:hypothetical protein SteCoe_3776 [Stentor coeruleus]